MSLQNLDSRVFLAALRINFSSRASNPFSARELSLQALEMSGGLSVGSMQ